ncbi:MAG: hypothetical protein ABIK09_17705 [Pseudomonadota bacterium]
MKGPRWDLPDRLPAAEDVELTPREEFYRSHPPAAFADAVRARRRSWTWLPAAGLVAAGALAATLLFVIAPWEPTAPAPTAPGALTHEAEDAAFGARGALREKSTSRPLAAQPAASVDLAVVALYGGQPVPVADGAPLARDTRIRFIYDSPDYDYLMLVSVTGAGEVTVLYPMTEGPSIPIIRGVGIPLQGAVQLDDHLGPERFFALFSPTPLAFEQVKGAIQESLRGGAPADGADRLRDLRRLPLDCAQATLLIEKKPDRKANHG